MGLPPLPIRVKVGSDLSRADKLFADEATYTKYHQLRGKAVGEDCLVIDLAININRGQRLSHGWGFRPGLVWRHVYFVEIHENDVDIQGLASINASAHKQPDL